MVIGERLKQLREARDFSQGDIEQKTGLLRCYTSRVENGHTVPSLETIQKYANALGVQMWEFFAEADGKKRHSLPLETSGSKDDVYMRQLRTAMVKLRPSDRAVVVKLAKTLAMAHSKAA